MALVLPRQTLSELSKATTPAEFKKMVFEMIDLSKVEVTLNRVLCAVYVRPEKTAGGIIRPMENVQEDVYQGKMALVLKLGPIAFEDDAKVSFEGFKVAPGDWVSFRIGNSSQVEIGKVPCRLITDQAIELKFIDPNMITS